MSAFSDIVIESAEREAARLRIALQGPSGAGKTWSSLLVAQGMVDALIAAGRLQARLKPYIGVLDTERGSARLYAHVARFDTISLKPPFSMERYLAALEAFERAGYPVVVIDQLSHAWAGEGGVLDQVDKLGGDNNAHGLAKWKEVTPEYNRFIERLLGSPAHLVVTMRAKTAWVIEQVEGRNGRTVNKPRRIGLQAVQRQGIEYEFSTLLDLSTDGNVATPLKDRTSLFTQPERLSKATGERLIGWMLSAPREAPPEPDHTTPAERAEALRVTGIERIDGARTVPDLAQVFGEVQAALRALGQEHGADVVREHLAAVVAAKDARKAALGRPDLPPGEVISADDVLSLELLCADAGVGMEELKAHFGVPRLALMPVARWADVMLWLQTAAAVKGRTITPIVRKAAPAAEAPKEPTLTDMARATMERVGVREDVREGGASLFADLQDDLP